MAGEKYIVATGENSVQIMVRNILNPSGYMFLGNCNDSISLMRLIRSYHPDFIVVDMSMQIRDLRRTLETIEDEMLCAVIIVGEYKDMDVSSLMEKSKILTCCPKSMLKELLAYSAEMSIISYRRVAELNKKLKEMTENYETRKSVERAKWILMERDGINENEAYERMRRKSMDSRMTMKAIAEAIIFTYDLGNI